MINTVSKEHEGRQIMDINWSRYIEIARAQETDYGYQLVQIH